MRIHAQLAVGRQPFERLALEHAGGVGGQPLETSRENTKKPPEMREPPAGFSENRSTMLAVRDQLAEP